MGRDLPRPLFADTFVKIRDRRAQGASNFEQSSGGYTIDTALVFMSLLVGYADHSGKLLLGQTKHNAPFAYPASHMIVDCGGRPPSLRLSHALHPCKSAFNVLIVARSISFNAITTGEYRPDCMPRQRPHALNNSDSSTVSRKNVLCETL
jgi:hypothetical protein